MPPGHLSQTSRPVQVRDGTLSLTASPRPGTLGGSGSDVAHWDLQAKLLESARRAADFLPGEAREQFLQLFNPVNLAITTAVLLAWALAQLTPAGWIADIVLILIALGTLGFAAFQVGGELGSYLRIAAEAKSEADLDEAARHLAVAVSTIGVTVFVALIMKAGAKLGGPAGAMAAARLGFFGRSVEEWLIVLGKPKAPPLVRERLETALEFFRDRIPGKEAGSIEGYIKGIDLAKPVARVSLDPGKELAMFGDKKAPGSFYTKPGTGMDRLGIHDESLKKGPFGTEAVRPREFLRLRVVSRIEALESIAGPAKDTWSIKGTQQYVGGGGTQSMIPDMAELIRSGQVKVLNPPISAEAFLKDLGGPGILYRTDYGDDDRSGSK